MLARQTHPFRGCPMIVDDYDYLAPGGSSFTVTSGKIAKLNKRSRVLEIGCGKGEAACTLAREFNCHVYAFDSEPDMIVYSRQKAKASGLDDRIEFEVKDGRDMDFGNGKYDMVLAEGGTLTYIGREEGVKYCAGILKEGGYLALTDLIYITKDVPKEVRDVYEGGAFQYLTEIGYREMLEKHCFEIVHLSMIPQSAWDRYYMSMRRRTMDPGGELFKGFKDSMRKEIDVYYNRGGMQSIGYVYIVARLAKKKQVKPGPDDLRIPILGMMG